MARTELGGRSALEGDQSPNCVEGKTSDVLHCACKVLLQGPEALNNGVTCFPLSVHCVAPRQYTAKYSGL